MKIEHIAIWVKDLEKMREFYMKYFGATSNEKYINSKKGFSSYFLSFSSGSTRLEIMHRKDMLEAGERMNFTQGITHFAMAVGDNEKVDRLTNQLRADNYTVASEPRMTGDGYYESVVLDPEGNTIEITTF